MGTSSSSRGPGSKSPLVPPWADTDGQGAGPVPPDARFTGFRINLGKFVIGGNTDDLRHALAQYASTATGGSAVGPRRFSSMASAGADLFGAMSSGGGVVGPSATDTGVDLRELNGVDTDTAIEALLNALVPPNGDSEKVREAMLEALSECLEGLTEFDFSQITDDMLVSMMITYVRECVFTQIVMDSARAFQRSGSVMRIEDAERALYELVRSAVDTHMRPLFAGGVRTLSRKAIEAIQLRAIQAVWTEWENYS